jgi:outer membrane receptor for ferrienterochelin and colicins
MLVCCLQVAALSQQTFRAKIIDAITHAVLAGATVTWQDHGKHAVSDSTGLVIIDNLQTGRQTFLISYVGFQDRTMHYAFPMTTDATVTIELEQASEDLEEAVTVTATRTSRTIANTPTRIEMISGEELAEKGNMKPGDIRMLLSESTGIQTQQTSATSYNAGIRIQGLDGRYTQILKDGYPLYAGFSGGLSILQIAPLDLKQVEVIKGSSSTLYGGGAIAGLVNLVSKTPGKDAEWSGIVNGTSAGGLDLSGFYSERYRKSGLTVYAARNSTAAYDPAGIGLTAIPKSTRYTINPRLFLYGKKTSADIGVSYITEDRIGGNLNYIRHGGSGYFESNNSDRITSTVGIAHQINERTTLQFKNSYSRFRRDILIPTYQFEAVQQSSFSELTLNHQRGKTEWIAGANVLTDDLSERPHSSDPLRSYHYNTFGIFVQNTWSPASIFTLESGIRADYVRPYGVELMPRVSAMLKLTPKLTMRLGSGFGYKTPTIFTEEAERIQFQHVLPIDMNMTQNERSIGVNWDINYRTTIGKISATMNHLFFYTRLNRPLILEPVANGYSAFQNATGHIDTKGMESNLRLIYGEFKLFIGYTYTDANTHYTANKNWLPLTARHRLNNTLVYEVEHKLKVGLEAYYFSKQLLSDGQFGRPYWLTGLMVEKLWKHFSVFINFENFTDTRQTRFDTIYTGTMDQPVFRDIYAPVEGFVVNGGLKIKW